MAVRKLMQTRVKFLMLGGELTEFLVCCVAHDPSGQESLLPCRLLNILGILESRRLESHRNAG